MLLKDRLNDIGNLLFRYRGYQFFIYFIAAFLGWKHSFITKDNFYYELICLVITILGMLIRAFTVGYVSIGTSGRNCHEQEAEELNTTGLYSIVRNPLYIGNYFIFLGVVMLTQDLRTTLIISIVYWIFYTPIILTEEAFLLEKFKAQYLNYTKEVNCLIPMFKNFKKPANKFSLHMVLMREHDTLLTTVLLFLATETIMEYAQLRKFQIDTFYIVFLILTVIIFSILKYIKKYRGLITSLFNKTSTV
jgi:protein-S-isoprenylcysteine O-methyltransferase Ste14